MGVAGVSDYQIWPENVAQPRAGLEQSLRARLIGSSESCRLVNGALHGARNKWAFFGAGRLRERLLSSELSRPSGSFGAKIRWS
jgi:hypothetical protein